MEVGALQGQLVNAEDHSPWVLDGFGCFMMVDVPCFYACAGLMQLPTNPKQSHVPLQLGDGFFGEAKSPRRAPLEIRQMRDASISKPKDHQKCKNLNLGKMLQKTWGELGLEKHPTPSYAASLGPFQEPSVRRRTFTSVA